MFNWTEIAKIVPCFTYPSLNTGWILVRKFLRMSRFRRLYQPFLSFGNRFFSDGAFNCVSLARWTFSINFQSTLFRHDLSWTTVSGLSLRITVFEDFLRRGYTGIRPSPSSVVSVKIEIMANCLCSDFLTGSQRTNYSFRATENSIKNQIIPNRIES